MFNMDLIVTSSVTYIGFIFLVILKCYLVIKRQNILDIIIVKFIVKFHVMVLTLDTLWSLKQYH